MSTSYPIRDVQKTVGFLSLQFGERSGLEIDI